MDVFAQMIYHIRNVQHMDFILKFQERKLKYIPFFKIKNNNMVLQHPIKKMLVRSQLKEVMERHFQVAFGVTSSFLWKFNLDTFEYENKDVTKFLSEVQYTQMLRIAKSQGVTNNILNLVDAIFTFEEKERQKYEEESFEEPTAKSTEDVFDMEYEDEFIFDGNGLELEEKNMRNEDVSKKETTGLLMKDSNSIFKAGVSHVNSVINISHSLSDTSVTLDEHPNKDYIQKLNTERDRINEQSNLQDKITVIGELIDQYKEESSKLEDNSKQLLANEFVQYYENILPKVITLNDQLIQEFDIHDRQTQALQNNNNNKEYSKFIATTLKYYETKQDEYKNDKAVANTYRNRIEILKGIKNEPVANKYL